MKKEDNKPKAVYAESVTSPIAGLTKEQYDMFLKFFGGNKEQVQDQTPQANMAGTHNNDLEWGVVDSGATEHMISQR